MRLRREREPDNPNGRPRIERLWAFLALVFTGWLVESLLLPVIPLVVLDNGGSATTVGLVALAYAVPSLLGRPVIGSFIDRRGFGGVQTAGSVGLALFPLGYLLPGLVFMVVTRLFQGVSWALHATGNNVLRAVLAPADRRGEVAGYTSAARAAAVLIGPVIGLWLYSAAPAAAIGAATAVGAVATLLSLRWRRTGLAAPRADVSSEKRRGLARFVETGSLAPMVMLSMFIAGQMLFLYFAPVFVQERGLDISVLAVFYPVFGLVLAVGPILLGRTSDRFGRERTIGWGCGLASVGLVVAALPSSGFTLFMIGAAIVGLTSSMVTTAISAAVIDRAKASHLGRSMATYSMGFQLSAGLGGLLWGALISLFGFPTPFVVAIAFQAVTILLARRWGRRAPVR